MYCQFFFESQCIMDASVIVQRSMRTDDATATTSRSTRLSLCHQTSPVVSLFNNTPTVSAVLQ